MKCWENMFSCGNKATVTYEGHIQSHKGQKLFFFQNEMKHQENMFPWHNKVTFTYEGHSRSQSSKTIFSQNDMKCWENIFPCGSKVTLTYKAHIQGDKGQKPFFFSKMRWNVKKTCFHVATKSPWPKKVIFKVTKVMTEGFAPLVAV